MPIEAKDRRPLPRPAPGPPQRSASGQSPRPFSFGVFLGVFLVAVAAGFAGNRLQGLFGLAVAAGIALLGSVAVAFVASRTRSALPPPRTAPSGTDELARERDRAARAATELLEKTKKHAEMASAQFREGKDPLTEIPELRVGPLRELLESARLGVTTPVLSRLTMSEEDLVATDGEPLPIPWPAGADDQPAAPTPIAPIAPIAPLSKGASETDMDAVLNADAAAIPAGGALSGGVEARAAMLRELDGLVDGLVELAAGLSAPRDAAGEGAGRTPAQLVDAVVHTAADGIEDLAAGLMRANELAGVAERVTNRATLLALNAALEATRSGSEAFAAIAEETRRLAEFAREATDTISRLSSEIEYKVGETITAIHATSEDAKSAVATFRSSGGSGPAIPTAAVERLIRRAQQLKRHLVAEAA